MKLMLTGAILAVLSCTSVSANLPACEPGKCCSPPGARPAPRRQTSESAADNAYAGDESDAAVAAEESVDSPKEPDAQRPANAGGGRNATPRGPARSTTTATAPRTPASPASPAPRGQTLSYHDRVVRSVLTQQALLAANARLEAKLVELQRWDAAAQEKFRRAFGTTDERMRQAVAQRLVQQRQKNLQALAAITDAMNLEFYVQSKQPH